MRAVSVVICAENASIPGSSSRASRGNIRGNRIGASPAADGRVNTTASQMSECGFEDTTIGFNTMSGEQKVDTPALPTGMRLDKYLQRTGSPVHEAAVRNFFELEGNCGCCSGSGFEATLQGEGKINNETYAFRFEAKSCFKGNNFSKFCKHYKVQSFVLASDRR